MKPIRCIVEVISSEPDRYGNRYHFARFYNPSKGRGVFVTLEVGADSNAKYSAMDVTGDIESVLSIEYHIPKTEWKRKRANCGDILYDGSDEAKAALVELLKGRP